MCGIAGIIHFDGAPVPQGLVEEMCDTLRHRGPDDHGVVYFPMSASPSGGVAAALGNQRLSIIDVAGGYQPIGNEDGTIWASFNGEIYNFVELRERLIQEGHRFVTRSDTEVVVHAYEQWGDSFLCHLDGMFALAVWDSHNERLLLCRDRFGKKPLLYFDDGERIAFASEFQALLRVPGLPRDIDIEALGTYLAYMAIPAPQTIYQRVKKVPPAHMLIRDRAGTRLSRYWTLSFQPKAAIAEEEVVERVRALLGSAVRKRLMGEVPLGVFLSGGVDSSAVVAVMAELSDQPVKTFSIGFDEPRFDELQHARRVAEKFSCEHHEFVVQPSAVEVLPSLVQHLGEPFADSSVIPSWYLAKLTRQNVTVALNGDGGDEIFAGYGRHRANYLAERWRKLPKIMRKSTELLGARAQRFSRAAQLTQSERYRAWAGVFSQDLVKSLSNVIPAEEKIVPSEFLDAENLDEIDTILAVDTRFYLPTDLLVKMDITSMAHSLEVRSPLLDTELAEFVAALPSEYKVRNFTMKSLLKRAVAQSVPAANLRRPKQGFAVPISKWLRYDLRSFLFDHLQPSRVAQEGLLRQSAIDRLVANHVDGEADNAHQLWVLLMLELWHRTFLSP
ncbi:MAG: asparagine synthase (glutamine-hydrolyzing) [Acidobacteria bacterium]|nr:asparagine synthase (glutamine-hydrolyzing) [Acidobacteriota bacterium]